MVGPRTNVEIQIMHVGNITKENTDYWFAILQESEIAINADSNELYRYASHIQNLAADDKAIDVGVCVIIIDSIIGANADAEVIDDVNVILNECLDRCVAHSLYNKQLLGMNFSKKYEDSNALKQSIVQASQSICEKALNEDKNIQGKDIGIEFVTFLANEVLVD